ncbi:MAG: 5-(carboxyamino)imidazole ribonucleotide synthase [Verrucomicrobia bacterium]|nr:MAG: 5-(carboxyamino)imidazole ribonucleotide synthase [Verrucomicrobiota bacterium]
MKSSAAFLPGSTIGVMGSGQLGRMLALAARRMGYRIHTFSPEKDTPTGQVADLEISAAYGDESAVRAFARGVDVLTFEFENVPVQSVGWAAEHCVVRPSGRVLHVCQHRLREKEFLKEAGLPLPEFELVESLADLRAAVGRLGMPSVLKTAAFGYDGKGQRKLTKESDLSEVWSGFGGQSAVLEAWVPFEREISVLVARSAAGEIAAYPVCENVHANHVLDFTLVPARISGEEAHLALELAQRAAEALDLVGLLAVEMFLLSDGRVLINELAPRPHNSGHFSFDACVTSQFEQQLRAVCGLPLGATDLMRPAAMANLLGDLWAGGEPDWAAAAALPSVKIHLYGKAEARPGRKMGHLVALGRSLEEAAEQVREARRRLAQS